MRLLSVTLLLLAHVLPMVGNKEKIAVAKDFLDRAGFVKTDKIEVKAESPLFILPAKNEN